MEELKKEITMTDPMLSKMVLDSWYSTVKRASTFFEKLTDDEMLNQVAPNRNRGIYLFGHLAAVNDRMFPLLNLGEPMFPKLRDSYISTPDNTEVQDFLVTELREYWTRINAELQKHFDGLSAEEWLQKHNSISIEDFAKEPHRNRLNVVLSRTNHIGYHLGQLAFLKN
jgi:hypothetical protein